MSTQMIIKIDDGVKDRFSKFGNFEGKTISELIKELIEEHLWE